MSSHASHASMRMSINLLGTEYMSPSYPWPWKFTLPAWILLFGSTGRVYRSMENGASPQSLLPPPLYHRPVTVPMPCIRSAAGERVLSQFSLASGFFFFFLRLALPTASL